MAITWTKDWQGSDDGTILKAIDIKNIQDDLSVVQTVGDVLSIPGQVQGDLLYYDGADWVRLPAGTANQVLKTNGTGANPSWTDSVATGLNITNQATGDLLYFDGTYWIRLVPGADDTVLTSNGAGVAPSYQAIPTPSGSGTVSFRATGHAGGTVYADAYVDTFDLWTTENFDTGSNFDPTTGTFTAPQAGKYLFTFFVSTTVTAGTCQFNISVGGVECARNSGGPIFSSVILDLAQSATVQITLYQALNGNNWNITGFSTASFCGTLLI
jgi:hypothetical protein